MTTNLNALTARAEALTYVARMLASAGVEDERREAKALLLAAAHLTPAELVLSPDAALGEEAARQLAAFTSRRAGREPLSRIVGSRGFWTLELSVAPDVLDPRPDTETLVELALDLFRERRKAALSILDLGAGSGAIVCALLAEFRAARAVAVDFSPAACAATSRNLERCGQAGRGNVMQGRWADAINATFDLVVSNPPYIETGAIDALDPEVRGHDPRLALDGGIDGLDCYREIVHSLPRLLAPNGVALLELGAGQAAAVVDLLNDQRLTVLATKCDAAGHERCIAAVLSSQEP